MNQYAILNSRKRAIIALVHSIAFGFLAFYQLVTNYRPLPLIAAHRPHVAGPVALTVVYLLVTTILLVLAWYSRPKLERLYFAFCVTSAAVGLWRVAIGDPTLHLGSLIRVLMLGCAVIVGTIILRVHTVASTQFAD